MRSSRGSRRAHIKAFGLEDVPDGLALHEFEKGCDFRIARGGLERRHVIANGLVQVFIDDMQLSQLIRQMGFVQDADGAWAGCGKRSGQQFDVLSRLDLVLDPVP